MSGNAEMLPQGGKLKPPMIVGSAMQSFLVVKNRKIHFEINEFYPFYAGAYHSKKSRTLSQKSQTKILSKNPKIL